MTRREIISGLVAICGGSSFAQARLGEENDRAYLVSMIRLIANPRSFDRRRVRLAGYIERGGGLDNSVSLYVSQVDGQYGIFSNAIALKGESGTTMRRFLGKYVLLNATFYALEGSMAEFENGYLDKISGLMAIPTRE